MVDIQATASRYPAKMGYHRPGVAEASLSRARRDLQRFFDERKTIGRVGLADCTDPVLAQPQEASGYVASIMKPLASGVTGPGRAADPCPVVPVVRAAAPHIHPRTYFSYLR